MVGGEESWYRGDENDDKARESFEALLRLQLYWPDTDEFKEFSAEVKARSLRDYGFLFGHEKVGLG